MRTLFLSTAMLAMVAAVPADAGQRVVMRGPGMNGGGMSRPGGWNQPRPAGNWNTPRPGNWNQSRPGGNWNAPRPGQHVGGGNVHRPRWGGHIGGRWWGGSRAPGGWNAYRRPVRGYVLPSYWSAPSFYINDWQSYGLPQAPTGYTWSRYYDDAVLIDGRGSVYDRIGGVQWDQVDGNDVDYSYYDDTSDAYAYDEGDYDQDAYRQGGYGYPDRRDNGLGGAAVGAVAGGVVGNLIAGRGNRLGGTLIGAGVGAAAGYAIDRNEDRGRRAPPPPAYGAGYPVSVQGGYRPQPGHAYPQGGAPVYAGGGNTVVTSGSYSNGYYVNGPSVTTVTVTTQPIVTTTTTEFYEDHVTYTKPARVAPRKTWRPRAKPRCYCQ